MSRFFICFLSVIFLLPTLFLEAEEFMIAGKTYSFGNLPECVKTKGFGPREKEGCRTRTGQAAVLLKVRNPGLFRDSRIEFEVTPFSGPDASPVQRATLYCGYTSDRPAASWKCTGPGVYTLTPRLSDVKEGVLTVFFFLPDVPAEGGRGLLFRSVTLRRTAPLWSPGKHSAKTPSPGQGNTAGQGLTELIPGKTVPPGGKQSWLQLKGFAPPDPEGGVFNIGETSSVTFRLPLSFQDELAEVALDVAPVLPLGILVRYVNVTVNGQLADSWTFLKRERRILRIDSSASPVVTVTLEAVPGRDGRRENSFRLLGVTLRNRNSDGSPER